MSGARFLFQIHLSESAPLRPALRPLVPFWTRPPVHLTSLITRTRTPRLRKRRLHHARMPHPHLGTTGPPWMPRHPRLCLQQTRHLMHPGSVQMLDCLHQMKRLRPTRMPRPLVWAFHPFRSSWTTLWNFPSALRHLRLTMRPFVHFRLAFWPTRMP